jgi:hypothetical protein
MTRYLLVFDLGPSPFGLVTIFYCLRFETSIFVASYDSQDHGGGVRPRLHTGMDPNIIRVALYSLRADRTENAASIVGTCLPNHCIATVAALTA